MSTAPPPGMASPSSLAIWGLLGVILVIDIALAVVIWRHEDHTR